LILGSYTKLRAKNSKIWVCQRLPKIASEILGVNRVPSESGLDALKKEQKDLPVSVPAPAPSAAKKKKKNRLYWNELALACLLFFLFVGNKLNEEYGTNRPPSEQKHPSPPYPLPPTKLAWVEIEMVPENLVRLPLAEVRVGSPNRVKVDDSLSAGRFRFEFSSLDLTPGCSAIVSNPCLDGTF
jgi:hypothetical protein